MGAEGIESSSDTTSASAIWRRVRSLDKARSHVLALAVVVLVVLALFGALLVSNTIATREAIRRIEEQHVPRIERTIESAEEVLREWRDVEVQRSNDLQRALEERLEELDE